MRKKAYAGLALLLLTLQFLAIPIKVHAAPADLVWQTPSGAGGTMGSIQWLTRLSFKSPISIIDSVTNTEYRMNDEIFGNGTSSFLNDGGDSNAWYIYVPVDSAKKPIPNPSGQCLGVIAAELKDDGSDMWLKAIQPQRTTDGSECAIGGVSAKQGRVQGAIGDNERARMYDIGSGGQEINGRDSRWRNFIAPFFWANKDSIRGFDTTQPDFKPVAGTQLDTLKSAWENTTASEAPPAEVRRGIVLPNGTRQSWSFFQSTACVEEVLVVSSSKNEMYIFKPRILRPAPPNPSDPLYRDRIIDAQSSGFSDCALGRNLEGGSTDLINAVGIPTPIALSENASLTAEQVNESEFLGSGSTADPNNPATADETAPPATCASTWRFGISWILCPVISIAEEMIDKVDDFLRNFLFVDIGRFDTKGGLYQAWNTLRLISTIIIVIIALVMIFSEAMGAGIMDTYSVKKLLPRLVIAVIGIQLSWIITREIINIGNILGNGMQGLLLAPFEGLREQGLYGLLQVNEASGAAQGGLFVAALAGTIAAFGAISTVAIAVLIALIVAFVTLIVRYMVIILCVLFAPIAIAMSVMPGTQKTSKLWWESFEKAVLMYPIIMALLAAGKIVAYGLIQAGTIQAGTTNPNNTSTKTDGWFILAAIVAYFAPYALIPATLKAGGTALNKLTGAFNDKSKGFFDKIKGFQDNRSKIKSAARQRNAFDKNHTSWYARGAGRYLGGGVLEKGLKAKSRGAAYLAAGTIGTESKFERDNMRVNASKESAQRRLFNKDQALAEVKSQEAKVAAQRADLDLQSSSVKGSLTYTDRSGAQQTITGFQYGSKDDLETIVRNSSDKAQVQAALSRLNTLGADDTIRKINQDYTAGTLSGGFSDGSTLAQTFGEHKLTGDYVGAFKDKAPDLYKPGAFKDSKADAMVNWTDGTINEAVRQLQEIRTAAIASGDASKIAEADDAWSRFGQSIHQITNDPKLSGRMSNGALAAINANNATIVRELQATTNLDSTQKADYAASIGRIQGNGTIQ